MPNPERMVALIFPPVPSYSRALAEGVIDQQSPSRRWQIIDLPHPKIGRPPLRLEPGTLDGAIVWADRRDRWIEAWTASGVRVVNCGSDWLGVPGVASIHVDHTLTATLLIEHLQSVGLKQLVLIGHALARRPGMQRMLGNIAARSEAAGIATRVWSLGGGENPEDAPQRILRADREDLLRELLIRIPKPSAIFCENDHIGVMVCRVAALAGLAVPQDIAVIGYGDNLVARFSDPPLTSIGPPGREIGRGAADLLAKWFARSHAPAPRAVTAGTPVVAVRESTVGRFGSAGMERVRRFIAKNEEPSASLATLARLADVSDKTLVRNYTAAFGITPLDDLRQRRLDRAKTALRDFELPITEVARICGFSSQANFYNYFLRHVGVSPSGYRESCGEDPPQP